MRTWLVIPLMASTLQAAVIRGTVVEGRTERPLTRATVVVEPVPGSAGIRMSVHTNRFGFFEVTEPAGMYLLQASREAFYPSQYGQKRWNSAGKPLVVTESETTFVTFRMLRFGSISGTVVDENGVGMPEFEVTAYLNSRPPQIGAHATSDDRGAFRIYGLLPDRYLIRTAGHQADNVGYRPTWGHETAELTEAHPVDVEMEEETRRVDVRPLPGVLYSLAVSAVPLDPDDVPVTITLASEMGRQIVKSGIHTFSGLPPGDYEIFASSDIGPLQSNYQRISLNRDLRIDLQLNRMRPMRLQFDGAPIQGGSVAAMARRKDLAGTYDLRIIQDLAVLDAGTWEFAISPVSGYYASSYSGSGYFRRNSHPEGWNEALITSPGGGQVRFGLSANVSSLHGLVKQSGEPVVGAPVFLEPLEIEPAKRVSLYYIAITDIHGQYRFAGLAPGRYRELCTFEYQMPDSKIMTNAPATEVQIDTRSDVARDLDLYVIR